MAFGQALAKLAGSGGGGVGAPPAPKVANIGAPPAQPHVQPPPYDAAVDPGWKGILDPNDHELRNLLNGLSPEERQVLLKRMSGAPSIAPGAVPPGGAVGLSAPPAIAALPAALGV